MTDATTDPQAVTSGTVDDLKAHLDTVKTPEQLAALRKAEEAGKARATALAAIDAKAADLDSNVTSAPADDAAKTDANAEPDANKPVTVLAEVPEPAKLTDADINDITGGGLHDDAGTQQSDAAETLVQLRDEAESGDEPERQYQHGMGPGADIG